MRRLSFSETMEVVSSAANVWIQYAMLGGSGVAAAFGQFLLAIVLLAVAAGLFLRVWRRRKLGRPTKS